MLSKSKVKQIRSLELKKFRNELNAFVAEGNKLVADMLHAFECDLLIAKPSWMATQGDIPAKELQEADDEDIRKASFLKNPQDVLAVFKRPVWSLEEADPANQLIIALDTRSRKPRYNHPAGRLVRDRTYRMQPGYGRRIQPQDRTGDYGCPGPCESTLHRPASLPASAT